MAKINLGNNRYAESTPAQEQEARDKIAELMADEAFIAKYTSDNPRIRNAAMNEMSLLHGRAYGNESNFGDSLTGTASKPQE